jgi:hypothetical protein
MPIRREHRFFYPIDWPQLSAVIRFRRAGAFVRAVGVRMVELSSIAWATGAGGTGREACSAGCDVTGGSRSA